MRFSTHGLMVIAALSGAADRAAGQAVSPPVPCDGPEFRQFDFWVGEWTVMVQDTLVAGTNRITPMLSGCAVREEWHGAKGMRGESVNMFDRASGKWRQAWVSDDGTVLLLEGGMVDGRMVLTGSRAAPRRPGLRLLDRITWWPQERGAVRQVWEISEDGGTTWHTIFDGRYTKTAAGASR